MARLPAEVVRDGLKVYAERGIFQEFRETQGRHGTTRFEFRLLDDPVTVELAERDHTLVIRNMLRQVPAAMYADLQQFSGGAVRSRSAASPAPRPALD